MQNITFQRALATPVEFIFKKKIYILHPLTLLEWSFLEQSYIEDENKENIETAFYAVWMSIRKENPNFKIKYLIRNIGIYPDVICRMMDLILDISMPIEEKKESVEKDDEINETILFKVFSELYGWTPADVSAMTPLQLCMYIDFIASDKNSEKKIKVSSLQEARDMLFQMKNNFKE
ncbi:MAG: hypothetical protein ACTSQB_00180 [Candidatus Heimdallarchaeota archaeon]